MPIVFDTQHIEVTKVLLFSLNHVAAIFPGEFRIAGWNTAVKNWPIYAYFNELLINILTNEPKIINEAEIIKPICIEILSIIYASGIQQMGYKIIYNNENKSTEKWFKW